MGRHKIRGVPGGGGAGVRAASSTPEILPLYTESEKILRHFVIFCNFSLGGFCVQEYIVFILLLGITQYKELSVYVQYMVFCVCPLALIE